jgi:multidrug efflux pump subunit AcrA (membrane-fusion protein)
MGIRLGDPRQIGDTEGSRFPAEVVVPNAQLQVVSSVLPGVIERLLVGEGEEVQAGQVLLQLKSPTLLEREGNYLQLLTKRDLAVRTMARDSKLAEEGIIARRRQQESEAAHQELATLAEAERQSLALAGLPEARIAELTDKRLLHSGLDIVSPLDGVVLEQMVIAGQRVEAATPLYRIGKLRPLWLEIHVPLARAATARIGGRVRLPDQAAEGRIIAVGREVHREDQGVLIRAVVEDGAERLRPRQFVQVQVVEVGREPAFRVPRTAVVRDGAEAFLFLQIQGGFVARVVRILDEQGEEFLVAGNIPVGARMVVAGTVALKAALLGGPEGYHPP